LPGLSTAPAHTASISRLAKGLGSPPPPLADALHFADALVAGGGVRRGYLGVSTQSVPLPSSLQTSLGMTQERGLLVVQVESGGPADAAGLSLGDILLGLGGTALDDVDDLRRHLRGLAAGQAVTLNLARGGAAHALTVTLGARE